MKPTLNPRISISYTLLLALITVLLLSGFITNFLSFTSLGLGTIIVDLLIGLLLTYTVLTLLFRYFSRIKVNREYLFFAAFWFLLLLFTLGKIMLIDENPIRERILGLRNNLLYCLPILYVPLLIQSEKHVQKSVRVLLGLGLALCLYAMFQFFFASNLPLSFLVLRGEGAFRFYDQEITRPTALVGNTIIFSSFTLLLFCLYFSNYLIHKKRLYLLIVGIVLTTNIMTFTRATLAGIFLSGGVILILNYGRFTLLYTLKLLFAFIILLSSILFLGYLYKDSFLVKRITSREASTIHSDQGHFSMIENSISYLKEHYLVGSGIGSQGPSSNPETVIITDGYWFQLFLENGLLLGFFYVTFYFLCFYYVLQAYFKSKNDHLRYLCLAFIGISVYFYAASFFNSAFIGRINFILYWILFGLIMAQRLILKKNDNAALSH
ncbi:O-antigen ligase family protein [Rufibacter tibetensis]|uniref:O-antigen ligase-related domain-containing protein n=1 Tax=Rufibacter tibetensis TaxID=512763 RepID=A0A0N7HWV7_9BACT|nr:hypothetical protein DC20_16765 [Rufibacter tibetensis]